MGRAEKAWFREFGAASPSEQEELLEARRLRVGFELVRRVKGKEAAQTWLKIQTQEQVAETPTPDQPVDLDNLGS